MLRLLTTALVLVSLRGVRGADDPPPAPAAPVVPAPTPPRRPPPPPPRPGIRWEREFEPGFRRAVNEGRPIFVAVNALLDEGERGNVFLARDTYASPAMGVGTRPFVCFVANPTGHATDRDAAGAETCRAYAWGTCSCHQEAMTWVLARLASPDGSIISPYHALLDSDLRIVYRGEYQQSCPTPAALETWLVELSPSSALREVWTTREARLDALSNSATATLREAALDWIATRDPMAAAGLVALHEQESDAARRAALREAIGRAGAAALPLIEGLVLAVTASPDADPDATSDWLDLALQVDPAFGALSTARAVLRTKEPARRDALWARAGKAAREGGADALAAARIEASALRGVEGVREEIPAIATAAGWVPARRLRAEIRSGATIPAPRSDDRDAVRSWLYEAVAASRPVDVALAVTAFSRPEEEVRIAAALALRAAGDFRGAGLLRAAIADPVEGPEVRAALARLAGGDRGEDPEAWADVLAVPPPGGGK